MSESSATGHSWLNRIGWFLLLWIAGVSALAAVALLMRQLLLAAGLKG